MSAMAGNKVAVGAKEEVGKIETRVITVDRGFGLTIRAVAMWWVWPMLLQIYTGMWKSI